jgi:hypothetical protein
MHHHLTMLIEAVERGMSARRPAPHVATAPRARLAPPPPTVVLAPGLAPAPARARQRPAPAPDGDPERRGQRRERRPLPASAPQLDPVAIFWGVNIACWLGVTAVAMVWGVG